ILAALMDPQVMEERDSVPLEEMYRLRMYIHVLSEVHDLLMEQSQKGAEALTLPIHSLLPKVMMIVQQTAGDRTLFFDGDEAHLEARQGTSLALIVCELSSNAIQHSAGDIYLT